MKICLINPPLQYKKNYNEEWSNNSIFNFQQLGLGYIAACFEKEGYHVDVIDCPCQNINNKDAIKLLLSEDYDIVGFSVFYYNLLNAKRIMLKLALSKPKTILIAGGYVATLNYNELLKNNKNILCCFLGEGEYNLIQFYENLLYGDDWKSTDGIAYIENDQIIVNDVKNIPSNLDMLPIPKRFRQENKSRTLSILTSRGCYGSCSFCSERSFHEKNHSILMRFRTPRNVVDEIKYLAETYAPKFINMNDANFLQGTNKRKQWLMEFIDLMKKSNLHIDIRINTRANDVLYFKDLIEDMSLIGITYIFLGIESFNQRQLDLYNKKITVKENIEAIKILKAQKVNIGIGFMTLEPFVSLSEIKENLEILKKLDIINYLDYNQYFFSIGCKLYAIKDTNLYKIIEADNLTSQNDLGYIFRNKDVQKYYMLIKEWEKIISGCNKNRYLIDKAIYYENQEMECYIKRWLHKVMELDLDFMIALLDYINEEKDKISAFIEKWSNKLKILDEKYLDQLELFEMEKYRSI